MNTVFSAQVTSEFGSKCGAYWRDVIPKDDCTLDWCNSEWCFVNPRECEYPVFNSHLSGDNNEDMYLSYVPCDNLGTYEVASVTETFSHLRGQTIRVAVPSISENGYDPFFFRREDGTVDGSVAAFLKEILYDPLSLQVEYKNVSTESDSKFVSKFTACVHDIALGKVDLCSHAFFRTPERLFMGVRFTTTVATLKTILIVSREDADGTNNDLSIWDYLLIPLAPFNWRAWVSIIFACLYMEIARRIVRRKLQGKIIQNPQKECVQGCFNAIVSTTSGSVAYKTENVSTAEKVIIAGFQIFVFIFISAYTASFTLSLIQASGQDPIEGMQEVVHNGGKVCMLDSIRNEIMADYDFMDSNNAIGVEFYEHTTAGMDRGGCQAALVSRGYYGKRMSEDYEFCRTKTAVGAALAETPLSIPASAKFASVLGYLVLEAVNQGTFDKYYSKYYNEFAGQPICEVSTSEEERKLRSSTNGHASSFELDISAANDKNNAKVTAIRRFTQKRKLKGTGKAGSASAGAADESSDSDGGGDDLGMSALHLLLPIAVTYLATTMGLILFLYTKHYRHRIAYIFSARGKTGNEQERSAVVDQYIREDIENKPVGEIVAILFEDDLIPKSSVERALNRLPDRTDLLRLLHLRRSHDEKFKATLESLYQSPISSIYNYLSRNGCEKEAQKALGAHNPKRALINVVVKLNVTNALDDSVLLGTSRGQSTPRSTLWHRFNKKTRNVQRKKLSTMETDQDDESIDDEASIDKDIIADDDFYSYYDR